MFYKPFDEIDVRNRCVVILAAGEGTRLRSFVQKLLGNSLPKQYVRFLGNRSMLESTFHRARKLIPSERLFAVVSRSHFEYAEVSQQLAKYPNARVVVQPVNRDTGMGLLLPLAHLFKRHPESTVVMFPSDHFIREEDLFLAHVDAAFGLVEQDPAKIVLLGVTPTAVEADYGYIVPRHNPRNPFPFGAKKVGRFIEKPDAIPARRLILRGGLWNTMVMIFKTKTLLERVSCISPQLHRSFVRIYEAIGTSTLKDVVNQVYVQVEPVNLSRGLLETLSIQRPSPLLVLPVRGVHWSDWGSEERIMSMLGKIEKLNHPDRVPQYVITSPSRENVEGVA